MSDGGGGGMNYNQLDRSVITTIPDALNQKGPTVRNTSILLRNPVHLMFCCAPTYLILQYIRV